MQFEDQEKYLYNSNLKKSQTIKNRKEIKKVDEIEIDAIEEIKTNNNNQVLNFF